MSDMRKKRIVTDTLIRAGVNVADKGFYILRDIILNYLEYEIPAEAVQEKVFSNVGNKYGMKYTAVYRNVNFLIENISRQKSVDFLEHYFGIGYRADRGKVMPKTFIIRIVDDVNMQCEKTEEEKNRERKNLF